MTWASLPRDVQAVAEQVLTRKQLDVFKLELAGATTRRTALMCGVSRWTVREHLDAAHDKLERAGVRHGHEGWTLEEAA